MESWTGVDGSKGSLLFDYLVNLIQTGQANSFGNTYQEPEEFLWYREDSHEYFFDNHLARNCVCICYSRAGMMGDRQAIVFAIDKDVYVK